jgi:hypothetical protein
MPTLTRIVGYIYNAIGSKVTSGRLTLTLQQDIISVDGTKVAPVPVEIDLDPLPAPSGVAVFVIGTAGSTTYSYRIVAVDNDGNYTTPSTAVTTATGNATLNGSNYNYISWTAVPGAASYRVYGRTSGSEQLIATTALTEYNDTGLAPSGALPTVNTTGGYVYQQVYATVGASPSGVAYYVEYDPDPDDTSMPVNHKPGYWYNYWTVPNQTSVTIGTFTQASRGQTLASYMPLSSVVATAADILTLGASAAATSKSIRANQASNTPELRFNVATSKWQFSNDGSTFEDMVTPSGAATTISATAPSLRFAETDQGVGLKNWDLRVEGQQFELRTLDDSFASPSTILSIARPNNLATFSGNVNSTRTSYPEFQAKWSTQANIGRLHMPTSDQVDVTFNMSYTGSWNLDDTTRVGWQMGFNRSSDRFAIFRASAGSNPRTPIELFRLSNTGQIFERGRTAAMGEWIAYTPTWTSVSGTPSLGNGSLTGEYTIIGKTCLARIYFKYGSSSTPPSGAWLFSLPLEAVPLVSGFDVIGSGVIHDISVGVYSATVSLYNTTTAYPWNADVVTNGIVNSGGTNIPFLFVTNDYITMQVSYRIA